MPLAAARCNNCNVKLAWEVDHGDDEDVDDDDDNNGRSSYPWSMKDWFVHTTVKMLEKNNYTRGRPPRSHRDLTIYHHSRLDAKGDETRETVGATFLRNGRASTQRAAKRRFAIRTHQKAKVKLHSLKHPEAVRPRWGSLMDRFYNKKKQPPNDHSCFWSMHMRIEYCIGNSGVGPVKVFLPGDFLFHS